MKKIPLVAIIVVIAVCILYLIPKIMKNKTYKKLTDCLSNQDYETFEYCLDGFWATFSFRPYNREYMRLTAYFMQNDENKINDQINKMFDKLRMSKVQKSALGKRAFYFYLESKNHDKAADMLSICKEYKLDENELHVMDMMFSILALKKSDHIKEIKDDLDIISKQRSTQANIVKIGVYEYLLGLQYSYLENKKQANKYLKDALVHCKNTPYEHQIKELLKG